MDILCGLCLTCWPLPRSRRTACHDSTCPCHVERATGTGAWAADWNRPHIPTTDYYDGRDGSIEAEDDDEDRIADAAEAWQDYLEFQRTSH